MLRFKPLFSCIGKCLQGLDPLAFLPHMFLTLSPLTANLGRKTKTMKTLEKEPHHMEGEPWPPEGGPGLVTED